MDADFENTHMQEKEEYKDFSIVVKEYEGQEKFYIKINKKRKLTKDGWNRSEILIPLNDPISTVQEE